MRKKLVALARLFVADRRAVLLLFFCVFAAGALLRLYGVEPVGWVPDQYDRLIEARNMLHGHLPSSRMYPPGFTLILIIPIAIFSASLGTIVGVTILFGMAMIPLAYFLGIQVAKDRVTAIFFAGACAVSPFLVLSSRAAYIDVVVAFFGVLALFLLPIIRKKLYASYAAFGLLLGLLFILRPTNSILLVPLATYWLMLENEAPWRLKLKAAATAGVAFSAVCVLSILLGNWYGGGTGGLISLAKSPDNLLHYWWILVSGQLFVFLLPLVLFGAAELWKVNRPFTVTCVLTIVLWPLAYSPFLFFNVRYMDLALILVYLLASYGIACLFRLAPRKENIRLRLFRLWAYGCLGMLIFFFAAASIILSARWDESVAQSNSALLTELRPNIVQAPSDSLIVSAVSQAFFDDTLPLQHLDLMEQSLRIPDAEESAKAVVLQVESALDQGRSVYYIYGDMEYRTESWGGIWDDYQRYIDALRKNFDVQEIARTQNGSDSGKQPWILYRVSVRSDQSPSLQTGNISH